MKYAPCESVDWNLRYIRWWGQWPPEGKTLRALYMPYSVIMFALFVASIPIASIGYFLHKGNVQLKEVTASIYMTAELTFFIVRAGKIQRILLLNKSVSSWR